MKWTARSETMFWYAFLCNYIIVLSWIINTRMDSYCWMSLAILLWWPHQKDIATDWGLFVYHTLMVNCRYWRALKSNDGGHFIAAETSISGPKDCTMFKICMLHMLDDLFICKSLSPSRELLWVNEEVYLRVVTACMNGNKWVNISGDRQIKM